MLAPHCCEAADWCWPPTVVRQPTGVGLPRACRAQAPPRFLLHPPPHTHTPTQCSIARGGAPPHLFVVPLCSIVCVCVCVRPPCVARRRRRRAWSVPPRPTPRPRPWPTCPWPRSSAACANCASPSRALAWDLCARAPPPACSLGFCCCWPTPHHPPCSRGVCVHAPHHPPACTPVTAHSLRSARTRARWSWRTGHTFAARTRANLCRVGWRALGRACGPRPPAPPSSIPCPPSSVPFPRSSVRFPPSSVRFPRSSDCALVSRVPFPRSSVRFPPSSVRFPRSSDCALVSRVPAPGQADRWQHVPSCSPPPPPTPPPMVPRLFGEDAAARLARLRIHEDEAHDDLALGGGNEIVRGRLQGLLLRVHVHSCDLCVCVAALPPPPLPAIQSLRGVALDPCVCVCLSAVFRPGRPASMCAARRVV